MTNKRGGFTLIEVVLSMTLLTVVVTGFMVMVLGNTNALARLHRADRMGYLSGGMAEDQQGVKTGESWELYFSGDGMTGRSSLHLYEYQVQMRTYGDLEEYGMYYVDYQ